MWKKMIIKKSSSSSSKDLPVEIETEIINKILDLKTLCVLKGVCKRFRDIASLANTIVYTSRKRYKFESVMPSLLKFPSLKFLRIVVHPSKPDDDHRPASLYKWKIVSLDIGSRNIDSFVFLSLDSKNNETTDDDSQENDGVDEEDDDDDDDDMFDEKFALSTECLKDAIRRYKMVLSCVVKDDQILPLLEMVSITDTDNRGRVTAGEEEISQMRKLQGDDQCNAEMVGQLPDGYYAYAASLKLPVSGYVMKGVSMFWYMIGSREDGFKILLMDDGGDDKEEMIYNEAIKEMLHSRDFMDIMDEFLPSLSIC